MKTTLFLTAAFLGGLIYLNAPTDAERYHAEQRAIAQSERAERELVVLEAQYANQKALAKELNCAYAKSPACKELSVYKGFTAGKIRELKRETE